MGSRGLVLGAAVRVSLREDVENSLPRSFSPLYPLAVALNDGPRKGAAMPVSSLLPGLGQGKLVIVVLRSGIDGGGSGERNGEANIENFRVGDHKTKKKFSITFLLVEEFV
jgi:hypothetical protein